MTSIVKTESSPKVANPAPKEEHGFTEALVFAYQQILQAILGQKKDQIELLKITEDSIAFQEKKNDELNKLDFFLAGDVNAGIKEKWENMSAADKDQYYFHLYCNTNGIPYNHSNVRCINAQKWWDHLSAGDKPKFSEADAMELCRPAAEADINSNLHTDMVLIRNETVTKERDYISNQIVIQQQRQQVVQSQSQTTASGSSQSMGLAESLVGSLKTISEKICYVVG